MTGRTLASRTVTGVIAAMIAATAAATAVGFWLSYAGLHDFAVHAGLRGPEAWAWPGSVDLFILAGEAGVTIAALRRQQDRAAWVYLGLGFAASVTANVLHVDPSALAWTRYAVAAVPPVAAMLALAALLRQVYKTAESAEPQDRGHPLGDQVEEPAPAEPDTAPEVPAALNGHADRAAELFAADLERGEVPGVRRIRREMHLGQPRAQQVREYLTGLAQALGPDRAARDPRRARHPRDPAARPQAHARHAAAIGWRAGQDRLRAARPPVGHRHPDRVRPRHAGRPEAGSQPFRRADRGGVSDAKYQASITRPDRVVP